MDIRPKPPVLHCILGSHSARRAGLQRHPCRSLVSGDSSPSRLACTASITGRRYVRLHSVYRWTRPNTDGAQKNWPAEGAGTYRPSCGALYGPARGPAGRHAPPHRKHRASQQQRVTTKQCCAKMRNIVPRTAPGNHQAIVQTQQPRGVRRC